MGSRIRDRREQLHLTQQALADRLGVAQQVVGRWETGASNPKLHHLAALTEALGVTSDWLLGITETKPSHRVEAALADDTRISPASRRAILAAYRAAVDLPRVDGND